MCPETRFRKLGTGRSPVMGLRFSACWKRAVLGRFRAVKGTWFQARAYGQRTPVGPVPRESQPM
eukprot:evm.model.NODE_30216_length_3568_cov_11.912556.1